MELKPGYKQTDVGVIPEDWEVVSLGSVASFTSGNGISVAALYQQSPDTPVPVFGGNGIAGYTTKPLIQEPVVVVGRVGQKCGEVYITQGPAWITDNALYPRTIFRMIDMRFLALAMKAAGLNNVKNRNDLPLITQSILHSVRIPLPPLPEQRAIAAALSDVDALLNGLERLIAKKRAIKQATMQQLLTGKTRLPGFSGAWEGVTLGQLGKCYRGVSYNPGTDLSAFDTASTVRLLRSNNVQDAKIVFVDMQFVDLSRVSEVQRLRQNDILICMANGSRELVGKAGRFATADKYEYTFGAFMGCFRPDAKTIDPNYAFNLFQTHDYRTHISILLAGSSINNLTSSDLEAFLIKIPADKVEQTAIAAVLSDMDAEITALEQRRDKTRLLKQGMMQELLTGRVRLVHNEELS